MAKSIGSLTLGSKIKDSNGNLFILIAKNHYGTNEVTLLSETSAKYMQMNPQSNLDLDYPNTEVAYYLNNDYLNTLDTQLANSIKVTSLPYTNALTTTQREPKKVDTKVFILSCTEVGFEQLFAGDGEQIDYIANNRGIVYKNLCWTRTEYIPDKYSFYHVAYSGYMSSSPLNGHYDVIPAFNLSSSTLVSDNVSGGYYTFMFNEPPVIQTIGNIQGNFGSSTNISYVATDNDDTELTHYISFDNGTKWQEIKPARNGNIYTYSHVFNELNTYYCRVKVVDGAKNEVVSNAFAITVNAVAPTVNIVSVVDKVMTFRTNCITSEISKVEILINDKVVKTFTNGFDFNLVYEIDRNNLNIGKNSIQIKATSQENLVGYANLEASKTKYNLPPVGTKVIIGGIEYTISNASEDGSNQTYTLNTNLINQVKKGDTVQVTQDLVKVLCSMSTLENVKDYKEMKLVKTKKLKGDLEGYVEEKYELQGEGRYSNIKLEIQRFNNNVSTEILELQQYFDYIED
ncbi:DUF6273 domain-containing protein [Romboutsia timonensis]|uniref:DUF6273 domain-containing protein n=1 Tax=Romboutsia timonensis TaxID=1776391 RepID=UPI0023F7BE82|nr:DUF6273 domain-containing protein [Romboutsia timonensis]